MSTVRNLCSPTLLLVLGILFVPGCGPAPDQVLTPSGTPDLREALFDSVLARTARREAFSDVKNQALGVDPLAAMDDLRASVVSAGSEEQLFYALVRLSNARRDRHLSVALVPGGLRPNVQSGVEVWGVGPPPAPREAPTRFLPDYSGSGYFVADVASGAIPATISPGDRIVALNGLPMEQVEEELRPFIRHSTVAGFRWKLAEALSRESGILPPSFRQGELIVEAMRPDGQPVSEVLPYLDPTSLQWAGASDPSYPGYGMEWSTPTYDLYLPSDERPVVLLAWHRFEPSLMEDIDRLLSFAEREGFLDHAVIVDATRSGGGSLGAYAVQRIQPRPFKTTYGNLRLSDIIEPFVQDRREAFQARRVFDGAGPETVDDGSWLLDWLEADVLDALARGDAYTEAVPFKLAHAPKDSDGVLHPAAVHFNGPLIVFSGPNGGSHLDQFMAIVADNDLGHIIGMPPGGYSNTWEWEETLIYPGTEQPVIGMMWSIGHTLRPNGEVLEGNPVQVDEWVPLTAENHSRYSIELLERAYRYLASLGR